LKPDAVLKHWACAKIMHAKPTATGTGKDAEMSGDDEVCQSIVDKFSKLGGASVSYADIAKRAWEVGRLGLATKVGGPFRIPCRHELTADSCSIMNPELLTRFLCFSA
jgi:hypothetical protein